MEVVEALLKAGANLEAADKRGCAAAQRVYSKTRAPIFLALRAQPVGRSAAARCFRHLVTVAVRHTALQKAAGIGQVTSTADEGPKKMIVRRLLKAGAVDTIPDDHHAKLDWDPSVRLPTAAAGLQTARQWPTHFVQCLS